VREAGILTSLDGGGLRSVAIVAERLCQQMGHEPAAMLDYLKSRGCRIGGVTLGERGLIWYDDGGAVRTLPALAVPSDRILDTSGAGDAFHGACVHSYLTDPSQAWEHHFCFARAAAAYKIQRLGNEAGPAGACRYRRARARARSAALICRSSKK
jgi:sugar/nucleoside kinase (ribokinase family)